MDIKMDSFNDEGLFCDVVIKCDDNKTFDAHRLVLAAASPYFQAMFQSRMLESSQHTIHLKGIDSHSLKALINYAYTSDINFDVEIVSNVLIAANMLCFDDIERACIDTLCANLNITNCIDILVIAERLNYEELNQEVLLFISKNFQMLVKYAHFGKLNSKQLEYILSNDALSATSESQVYKALITWVKFEPDARSKHLAVLLKHVRLILISRKFLIDEIMREPLIMDNIECRSLVLATLDHFLLPERRKTTYESLCCSSRSGDKKLFVIGGQDEKRVLDNVATYCFNEDKWKNVAALQFARRNAVAVVLEGVLYVIAGVGHSNNDLVSVEKYSIEDGEWRCAASLSKCKGAVCAVVIDGWIYVAGGSNGSQALKFTERYDCLTDQWTAVSNMRLQRSHFGMASLDGKIYAIGGYSGISELERCEYLDPVSLQWHEITCMNKARKNHAVITHNDRIYAIGGSNCISGSLNSVEKYNPDLNMWLVIRSCSSIRPGLVACSYQKDGKESHDFLLIGGYDMNEKEHREIKVLNLKSPDYRIRKFSEMKEKRVFASAVML